jgi:cobalamin biosynthesis protein CobD/CbiB
MSAMAGALQVELVKIGVYALGGGQLPPTAQDIARARRLMYGAVVLALALLLILMGFAAPDGTFV